MKFLAILLSLVAVTVESRSTFAGEKPIGQPELAYRFRETTENSVDLGNRLGDDTTTTEAVPFDDQLLAIIKTWPKENWPFEVINEEAIKQHIGQQQPTVNVVSRLDGSETIPAKPAVPKSPFAGSSRV